MPTTSEKQHRLMEAVAHEPKVAKKLGIPQTVGNELVAHDSARQQPESRSMDRKNK